MTFGLTSAGLEIKRAADIKTELRESFRSVFGKGINVDDRSLLGQIIGVVSEREALVWELVEEVYNSQYPDTAEGTSLENIAAITGTTKKAATKSIGTATLIGDAGTVISAGSVISVLGNSESRFVTDSDAIILPGTNEVQTITFSAVPDAGGFFLTFGLQTTVELLYTATSALVKSALEALEGIDQVTVTGNFTDGFVITFQGQNELSPQDLLVVSSNTLEESLNPVTVIVTETTPGVFPKVDVSITAESSGEIQAPAGTLTVIETPVSGWSSVTNELDATVGSNIESDQQLKLRRLSEISIAGKATIDAIRAAVLSITEVTAVVVFENHNDVEDSEGRPPNCVDIVVENGDNQEIADTIFDTVAGGIRTIGAITETVSDSQGFSHFIQFSRPDDILIYIEIDLTVNSEEFPSGGEALVEAALLAFGEEIGIGNDVIVYPRLICSFADIPGILDVVIRIGSGPIPADGFATVTPSDDTGELLFTTGAAHGLSDNNKVTFSSTGTLPTGIASGVVYHVIESTATTFKVATERGGDSITFTDVGSGVHTVNFGGRDDNIEIGPREVAKFDSSRIDVVVV